MWFLVEQRASKRSSTACTAHLHNSTSRSQSHPFPKSSPVLEMEACVDETVPLRAALQITSWEKNKEYRQDRGKREAGRLEG